MVRLETENAGLRSKVEELNEHIQRMNSETAGLRHKNDAKDEQLKLTNQTAAEMLEKLSSRSCDQNKESARKIVQLSKPGYLPPPVEETRYVQQHAQLPVTPNLMKSVSPTFQDKAAPNREHHPSASDTGQQKGVTLRAKSATRRAVSWH